MSMSISISISISPKLYTIPPSGYVQNAWYTIFGGDMKQTSSLHHCLDDRHDDTTTGDAGDAGRHGSGLAVRLMEDPSSSSSSFSSSLWRLWAFWSVTNRPVGPGPPSSGESRSNTQRHITALIFYA